MDNRPLTRHRLVWLLVAAATVATVYHADLVGRVAYALERGRLKAGIEHLATIDAEDVATLEQLSQAFSIVAEVVKPSVVNIEARSLNHFHEEFRRMFEERHLQIPPRTGTGSGVILDAQGHIVTNNHVIEDAETVSVTLADGRVYRAEIVGSDPMTDLAVLKIHADRLHAARFGDSQRVKVGQLVLAIGSPFRLGHSVSHGIISAIGRTDVKVDVDYQNWIQTDAPINPGNSGGPLINARGEVIGINVAIATDSGGHQGVGFAIPANTVARVAGLLKSGVAIKRGYLGVSIKPVTPKLADAYGLEEASGVFVDGVAPDAPAAEGGLQEEDVIVAVDGKTIRNPEMLQEVIAATQPGTEIEITVWRAGATRQLSITVGRQPEGFSTKPSRSFFEWYTEPGGHDEESPEETPDEVPESGLDGETDPVSETAVEFEELGFMADTVSPHLRKHYRLHRSIRSGALITQVNPIGEAYAANLMRGDVITKANGVEIDTVADLQRVLTHEAIAKGVRLKVKRGQATLYTFHTVLQVR